MKRLIIFIYILLTILFQSSVYASQQGGIKNVEEYAPVNRTIEFDQLTAATDWTMKIKLTNVDGRRIWKNVIFQVTVAGITTNVVYRLEGSLDGENFFNLAEDASNITKTANGTYSVDYVGDGQIIYLRLYWVSESGGTAATLDVIAKAYDKEISQ